MADIIDTEANSTQVSRYLSKEEYEKQGRVYTRLYMYDLIRNEDKSKLSEHPFYLRNMRIRNIVNFTVSLLMVAYGCGCAFCHMPLPSFTELKKAFKPSFHVFDIALEAAFAALLKTAFDQVSMMLKIDYYNKNKTRPVAFSLLYIFEFMVYYKAIIFSISSSIFGIDIVGNASWLLVVVSLIQELITDTKEVFLIGTVVALPVLLCCGTLPAYITLFALLSACKYARIN